MLMVDLQVWEPGMRTCVYCGDKKHSDEFSDEHIWPAALGGDFLPDDVWRTDDVCRECNNISGLFVDGSFIRSWMGKAERASDSLEYLAGGSKPVAIPLDYLGPIQNVPVPNDHIADYWAGPCGANIIHIRPDDGDEQWKTYAGGDPKAKKMKAGRAYMALTSENKFWIAVSLLSFKHHFKRAERFIVNMDFPSELPFFKPDRNDPVQAADMKTVDAVINHNRNGERLHIQLAMSVDLGNRLLAKLGLAVGYKLLGSGFLETENAKNLRLAMRERKTEKRKHIPVHGSGFFNGLGIADDEADMAWPGGWVLMVTSANTKLSLCVVSPSGRSMIVLISDDQSLVGKLDEVYKDGVIWLTVPAAKEAVGPISVGEYLSHHKNVVPSPRLVALASKRGDTKTLPPCNSPSDDDVSTDEPL